MRVMRLSLQNLKRNFTSYLAFIFSLSFCSFILYNFLNLMDSGALDILGKKIRNSVKSSLRQSLLYWYSLFSVSYGMLLMYSLGNEKKKWVLLSLWV